MTGWRWGQVLHHLELAVESYGADLAIPFEAPTATGEPGCGAATSQATAAAPADLEALKAEALSCTRCKLAECRTNVVFGEGSPSADVMFIGEAPGHDEDRQGRPFVGRAGQLLDRIIENAMGMQRDEVYIANVAKCRPPQNRNPEPDEVAACLPFLKAQIQSIAPRVIVIMGRVAAHSLLSTTLAMGRLRGQELNYEGIDVVATWHPAYLLRNPSSKRETWDDIKRVNRLLGRPEVPSPR